MADQDEDGFLQDDVFRVLVTGANRYAATHVTLSNGGNCPAP
jgi:hypothetical protein